MPTPGPEVTVDAIDGLEITYELPREWAYGLTTAGPILMDPTGRIGVTFGTWIASRAIPARRRIMGTDLGRTQRSTSSSCHSTA